ncbi:hypothetical protein BKA62DRAFT_777265 [Auriculariales sp. MPI-PUGE-AT-0066]|nr:hypothetical protein BKA62DRAFT_777265 [Auriculariales sp. MPI-PUGE-AT-0066]
MSTFTDSVSVTSVAAVNIHMDAAETSPSPLHTLNLFPERIVLPQLLPPKHVGPEQCAHAFVFPHSRRHRRSASSSSIDSDVSSMDSFSDSASSYMSAPTSSASPIAAPTHLPLPPSRWPSPLASPRSTVQLLPTGPEAANALLWFPDSESDGDSELAKEEGTLGAAVLLTGAAVSKHLRALERDRARGRAHPYRIVMFNRRGSVSMSERDGDHDDRMPSVRRHAHRASSEESD